jgi:hypothetical protein|eukprot:COSAG06_NODE_1096_length_10720_cov_195.594521_6_plen_119_part_00
MHDDEAAGGRSQERHGHLGHRLSPRSAKHSPKELMSATEDVSFENPLETGSSEPRALAELDIEAALKAGTLTEAQAIVQMERKMQAQREPWRGALLALRTWPAKPHPIRNSLTRLVAE